MNYIKEAENILWHYHDLYKSIQELNEKITFLIKKAGPKGLSGITANVDITGIHAGKIDDAINVLFELQKLQECKDNTCQELNKIEIILENISREKGCELYGKILRKWYIEKLPKEDIAEEFGYSSKQSVYDIKARAIRKFAVRMFGIDALKII